MRIGRAFSLAPAIACVLLLGGRVEAAVWQVPGDFPTIQAAIDSPLVLEGDTLRVMPGRRAGASVTKEVVLRAQGRVVINDGPVVNALGKAGFLFPGGGAGSGSVIAGFRFETVPFPVFSRGADDVSVTQNTMSAPLQGVTSWAGGTWGQGWDISHNVILDLRTSCGGGIGIMIGDYYGGTVTGNVIAHNEIRGTVRVPSSDCGAYNAPGILLFADFRGGAPGAAAIERNRVAKNRVFVASSNLALVTVAGIELSDTRDLAATLILQSNAVVYNDLRGMSVPVALTPDELASVNRIAKNRSGPVGNWPDRAFRSRRPDPSEAAPVR